MATVINRSRFSVTVARRPDLARTYPYNAEKKALAYVAKLRAHPCARTSQRSCATELLATTDHGHMNPCGTRRIARAKGFAPSDLGVGLCGLKHHNHALT